MDASIEIVFTFTRDEYIRAIRRHYKTRLHAGRDIVAGIISIVVGLYFFQSGGSSVLTWLFLIAGAILLTVVAYALLLLPTLLYRSQPKLRSEYRLKFSDEGIGFQTDEIDSILKWSLYHSWLGDDDFYIMYHGKRDMSVIPRRVFTSKGTDERFSELLKRKIGPAR